MSATVRSAPGTRGRRSTVTTIGGSVAGKMLDFGAANPIVIYHVLAIMTGLIIMAFARAQYMAVGLLWGLACLSAGGLGGFLFGIPRALQQPSAHPASPSGSTSTTAPDRGGSAVLGVNTNLEQISDWLTKIIVGIGLVELRKLPEYIKGITDYIAIGVGSEPDSKALVVASLVYFSIMGFIDSYLITRTYLSKVIKDFDDATISSNDIDVPVGGGSLPLTEVSRQVRENLNELRELVVKLHPDLLAQGLTTAPETRFPSKSALWVDDEPDKNSLAVEELGRLNVRIDTSTTTGDAMKLVASKAYDLVISDMNRVEAGAANPKAGIDLLQAVRAAKPGLPFVILSDSEAVKDYKDLEKSMTNIVVTSSRTELIAALHQFFQEPKPQPAATTSGATGEKPAAQATETSKP